MEGVIERCKEVMKRYKVTVNALSKLIGVSQSTLNNQFTGKSAMSLETFLAFINKFSDVSPAWLLRGSGSMFGQEASTVDVKAVTEMYEKLLKDRDDKIRELEMENVKLKASLHN